MVKRLAVGLLVSVLLLGSVGVPSGWAEDGGGDDGVHEEQRLEGGE